MRGSRIPHPPGGRMVKVWRWAVDAVGRSAATVLGELEWRDRLKDEPSQPVATRAELVSSLEGFVSRNHVDEALHTLVRLGWVQRHERTTLGERNLRTWHEFSLNTDAIAEFLMSPNGGAGSLEFPGSPFGDAGHPQPGTGTGTGTGMPSVDVDYNYHHCVVVGLAAQHGPEISRVALQAGLGDDDRQRLADALAGALALQKGDRRRPGNVARWLQATATALAKGDFVENDAYFAGREARRAHNAADPAAVVRERESQERRLSVSVATVDKAPSTVDSLIGARVRNRETGEIVIVTGCGAKVGSKHIFVTDIAKAIKAGQLELVHDPVAA